MNHRVAWLVTLALWIQSPASAPKTPPPIPVYVYTDARGDAPELAARRESAKDLSGALGKKKGLVPTEDEVEADVTIEVVERTTTIPKFAFGAVVPPGQHPGAPAVMTPVRQVHLRVKLRWRSAVFEFTNKNSPADTGGGWKSAAEDVAKQLEKWVADHAAELRSA